MYFRRGKVFHSAGSVDDALQLFLHCLALDEEFLPAKLEVEKVFELQIIVSYFIFTFLVLFSISTFSVGEESY